jgi:hypothetical protein
MTATGLRCRTAAKASSRPDDARRAWPDAAGSARGCAGSASGDAITSTMDVANGMMTGG